MTTLRPRRSERPDEGFVSLPRHSDDDHVAPAAAVSLLVPLTRDASVTVSPSSAATVAARSAWRDPGTTRWPARRTVAPGRAPGPRPHRERQRQVGGLAGGDGCHKPSLESVGTALVRRTSGPDGPIRGLDLRRRGNEPRSREGPAGRNAHNGGERGGVVSRRDHDADDQAIADLLRSVREIRTTLAIDLAAVAGRWRRIAPRSRGTSCRPLPTRSRPLAPGVVRVGRSRHDVAGAARCSHFRQCHCLVQSR